MRFHILQVTFVIVKCAVLVVHGHTFVFFRDSWLNMLASRVPLDDLELSQAVVSSGLTSSLSTGPVISYSLVAELLVLVLPF